MNLSIQCSVWGSLIDNILTNDIENNIVSGLLINDISDHLPVFTIYDKNYQINFPNKMQKTRTEESLTAFKNDLITQNWDEIYKMQNIDSAYDEFLRIFISL